ncbi:hypothetical protein BC629DRAFT_555811 [Irpex lacteus]|nr:hypothetical protein BC629DRAFT_555811 [Irpex lacteus]
MSLPVIPTLTEWAKTRVTALFEAKTAQEFDDAFNAFLAHHVDSIVVNGKKLSKAEYKASLERLRTPELSAEVKYLGDVEVKDEKEGEQAGEVGLFLQVHITERLSALGQHGTETVTVSFNLRVIQDPHQPIPILDARKVSSLTSVFTTVQNPLVPIQHSDPPIPPTSD